MCGGTFQPRTRVESLPRVKSAKNAIFFSTNMEQDGTVFIKFLSFSAPRFISYGILGCNNGASGCAIIAQYLCLLCTLRNQAARAQRHLFRLAPKGISSRFAGRSVLTSLLRPRWGGLRPSSLAIRSLGRRSYVRPVSGL